MNNGLITGVDSPIVYCDSAVSFWGGFDLATGRVIDKNSPLLNTSFADQVIYVPSLKGSTAAPGALLEWFQQDTRPRAIITPNYEPAIAVAINLHNSAQVEQIDYRVKTLTYYQAELHNGHCQLLNCEYLGPLINRFTPCQLAPSAAPFFATCVNTIVNQLISYKAADTIEARLKSLVGNPIQAESWLSADQQALRDCGLSKNKLNYCTQLAQLIVDQDLQVNQLWLLSTNELSRQLNAIKGFGRWSVEMMLMFYFGKLDIFAPQDVGLQRGLRQLSLADKSASLADYEQAAERWHPYRSIASWYLWQSVK